MSHESIWYSRPRVYGKGARAWYVSPPFFPLPLQCLLHLTSLKLQRMLYYTILY